MSDKIEMVKCECCETVVPKQYTAVVCLKCWGLSVLNECDQHKTSTIEKEESNDTKRDN